MSTAEVSLTYAIPPGLRRWWWVPLIAGILSTMVSLVLFRFDASSVRLGSSRASCSLAGRSRSSPS